MSQKQTEHQQEQQAHGERAKLAGLVEERYAISREAASNQVKQFIEKCKCA